MILGRKLSIRAALVIFAVTAACGAEKPHPTLSAEASPTTVAAGGTTMLTVAVTDFELLPPAGEGQEGHGAGGDADPNKGHYHVYLDSLETNPIAQDYRTPYELTIPAGTGAGAHTLIVRLNHVDHRFIVPEVKDSIGITVQ